jgi:hypothetical protein
VQADLPWTQAQVSLKLSNTGHGKIGGFVAQIEDFFYGWMLADWLIFVASFIAIFGLLNGVYSISRLIRKGSIPSVYWLLNGVFAVFAALYTVASL